VVFSRKANITAKKRLTLPACFLNMEETRSLYKKGDVDGAMLVYRTQNVRERQNP